MKENQWFRTAEHHDKAKRDKGVTMRVFHCPGCRCSHFIDTGWKLSYRDGKPTVTPSLLIKEPVEARKARHPKRGQTLCHFFIRNGQIQYLSDSAHVLAGKVVDMVLGEDE